MQQSTLEANCIDEYVYAYIYIYIYIIDKANSTMTLTTEDRHDVHINGTRR